MSDTQTRPGGSGSSGSDDLGAHELDVAVVAAERTVWTGRATLIKARTTEGDIGVMAGHEPVFSVLRGGVVEINTTDGERVIVAAPRGFLSVAGNNHISVLAEYAELADDIDLAKAREDYQQAESAGRGDEDEDLYRDRLVDLESRVLAAERRG